MAFSTLVTFDAQNRREDLLDVIVNISPTDTPFLSRFGVSTARQTLHETMTDSLAARGDNAVIEGADPTYPASDTVTRVNNILQIITKPIQVSRTMRRVATAGTRDEFMRQAAKALKELTNDIEHAIVRGSKASGSGSAARRMDGVINSITTTATAIASGTSLTEAFYNGHLQNIYDAGGDPDATYVGARVKRQISAFTAGSTKNVAAEDKTLWNGVDVYDSDFSRQMILLSRDMLQGGSSINALVAIQTDMWRTAWLDRPFLDNIPKTGDSTKAQYICELTLESLNEAANGKITGILG